MNRWLYGVFVEYKGLNKIKFLLFGCGLVGLYLFCLFSVKDDTSYWLHQFLNENELDYAFFSMFSIFLSSAFLSSSKQIDDTAVLKSMIAAGVTVLNMFLSKMIVAIGLGLLSISVFSVFGFFLLQLNPLVTAIYSLASVIIVIGIYFFFVLVFNRVTLGYIMLLVTFSPFVLVKMQPILALSVATTIMFIVMILFQTIGTHITSVRFKQGELTKPEPIVNSAWIQDKISHTIDRYFKPLEIRINQYALTGICYVIMKRFSQSTVTLGAIIFIGLMDSMDIRPIVLMVYVFTVFTSMCRAYQVVLDARRLRLLRGQQTTIFLMVYGISWLGVLPSLLLQTSIVYGILFQMTVPFTIALMVYIYELINERVNFIKRGM